MLPAGFGVEVDRAVRRPRPEVLVGGEPLRLIRLTARGVRLLDSWDSGTPVAQAAGPQALASRLLDAGMVNPRPRDASRPAESDVTVVMPVRDDPSGLSTTLSSLARYCEPRAVFVVDDGSSPEVALPEGTGSRLHLLRNERAEGPAAARNKGLRQSATDLVAFLDAGCRVSAQWLGPLLAHFADPRVGAVAPRVHPFAPRGTPRWLARYEAGRSPLDLGAQECSVRPGGRVSYVPTAALVARRSALEDVGGLDEHLLTGEDVDLVWRLRRKGWRVRYEPASSVHHPTRTSLTALLSQRRRYGSAAGPLAARHGGDVAPADVSLANSAAWALAVTGHPLACCVLAGASTAALACRSGRDYRTARLLASVGLENAVRFAPRLSEAVRRAWLPPAVLLAAGARRRSPAIALMASLVAAPAAEWFATPPGDGIVRWTALRLADDLAHQLGVWEGAVHARSARALLPRVRLSARYAHTDALSPSLEHTAGPPTHPGRTGLASPTMSAARPT